MKESEAMQRMNKHSTKYRSKDGASDGPPKGRHAKQTKKIITRNYQEEE